MAKTKDFVPTQLRKLYAALGSLHEEEQLKLAQLHASKPKVLAKRLAHSLATADGYPPLREDEDLIGADRTPLPNPPTPLLEVTTTEDFVSNLVGDNRWPVTDADELSFRYVEREVSPLRTTEPKGPRPDRRSLDLLLASDQGRPIAAELKVGKDAPSYYALVQALMYAAELQSPSQRRRLAHLYPDAGFAWPEKGPLIDIYLITFDPPATSRYREPTDAATESIAQSLAADGRFAPVVGSIVHLEAQAAGGGLVFDRKFAFSTGGEE